MDDFVLNVKQIASYPLAPSVLPARGDVLLLQQGGLGGPYQSLDPLVLFATALTQGGWLNLAPNTVGVMSAGIGFNGASITFSNGAFNFSEPVYVAGGVFANGQLLATETLVLGLFDGLAANVVNSFNGRKGNIILTMDDVRRAGAAPVVNPAFSGVVTAPTPWNFADCSNVVATTAWVQGAIDNAGFTGRMVKSFNGRGGCVVLTAEPTSPSR